MSDQTNEPTPLPYASGQFIGLGAERRPESINVSSGSTADDAELVQRLQERLLQPARARRESERNPSTESARHRIQNAVNEQSDFASMLHALIDAVGAELDSLHEPAQVTGEVVLDSPARDRGLAVDHVCKVLEQFPQHLRVADVLAVLRGVDDFSGSGHYGAPFIDPVGGVDGVGAPNPTHGFPHEGGAQ